MEYSEENLKQLSLADLLTLKNNWNLICLIDLTYEQSAKAHEIMDNEIKLRLNSIFIF